ncbi:unnamed protein product [Paramecium sonneborni]|uniref:WD40-repeat-containing domain n=1 Tax=Paramecium sonneborni TaxID=65129 RepID=A0A8S1RF02_9CILI|nr:unnamed protein product [Paramecium sonneborni]
MKTSKRDYYLSYCFDKSNMIEIIKYPQDECKHLKIKGKKDSIVILLEFSCQEEILISGNSDQSIRIWNVEYQIQFYCLDGFNQSISSLSISPDGNRFAVGFDDGTLSLFKFFQQQYSLQKMKNQIQQWENFEDQIEGKKNTIAENGKESEIKIIGATLYKSFSKQPLIQAKNCKINVDTIINDNQGQSLLQLFEQKGAIPEDLKN